MKKKCCITVNIENWLNYDVCTNGWYHNEWLSYSVTIQSACCTKMIIPHDVMLCVARFLSFSIIIYSSILCWMFIARLCVCVRASLCSIYLMWEGIESIMLTGFLVHVQNVTVHKYMSRINILNFSRAYFQSRSVYLRTTFYEIIYNLINILSPVNLNSHKSKRNVKIVHKLIIFLILFFTEWMNIN